MKLDSSKDLTADEQAAVHVSSMATLDTEWIGFNTVLHYHKEQLLKLIQQLDQGALEETANALRGISFDFYGRRDAISTGIAATVQETAVVFWSKFQDGEQASGVTIGGQRFKAACLRDSYFDDGGRAQGHLAVILPPPRTTALTDDRPVRYSPPLEL